MDKNYQDRPQYTPNRITHLRPDEVFVFGSNLQGQHGGGAARTALHHFGAQWGQGEGLQGQSYGIPTMHGGAEAIRPYVDRFIAFAGQHPELLFYVTRIGCGVAGHDEASIAALFRDALTLPNVRLPRSFVDRLQPKHTVKCDKTQIFNVVIIDRSGSMSHLREAVVSGFNDTLAGIQKAQQEHADTQDHYITLVAFCSCRLQTVYDRLPVVQARPLTLDDYEPCCCTPLYDAMGRTLTDMRRHVEQYDDATAVVTIMTDGLENASKEYSGARVKKLIDELRKEGWTFTYIGANQDAVEVATYLSIRNARNMDYSREGVRFSLSADIRTRENYYERLERRREQYRDLDCEERRRRYAQEADEAFDEENK